MTPSFPATGECLDLGWSRTIHSVLSLLPPCSASSSPSLSEKSSSLLTEGHSWNWGSDQKRHPLQDGKQESSWSGSVPSLVAASQAQRQTSYNHGCGCVQCQVGQCPRKVSTRRNSQHRLCRQHPSFQPVLHEETAG